MDLEQTSLFTDLRELEKQAELKWNINQSFRTWLGKLDPQSVAEAFDKHGREIASQIDCQTCGNCCRAHTIGVSKSDSKRLADHLSLSPADFRDKYLKKDFEGDLVLKQRPCPFLKSNSCSVYEARPTPCRSYPHLELNHMSGRGWKHLENTRICPIVFNVYERLREVYGFNETPNEKR